MAWRAEIGLRHFFFGARARHVGGVKCAPICIAPITSWRTIGVVSDFAGAQLLKPSGNDTVNVKRRGSDGIPPSNHLLAGIDRWQHVVLNWPW